MSSYTKLEIKSIAYSEDLLHTTREHNSLTIHLVQKITIIPAQKNQKFMFKILYSVVVPSGGAEKYDHGCTTTNHRLHKSSKTFF